MPRAFHLTRHYAHRVVPTRAGRYSSAAPSRRAAGVTAAGSRSSAINQDEPLAALQVEKAGSEGQRKLAEGYLGRSWAQVMTMCFASAMAEALRPFW